MRTVLFICHANLCRSPLAEGLMRAACERAGLRDVVVESAGIDAFEGSPPHPNSVEVAGERGVTLESTSRQLLRDDLARADVIIVMDRGQLRFLDRMMGPSAFSLHQDAARSGSMARVRRLRELIPTALREQLAQKRLARRPSRRDTSQLDPLDLPDPYRGDLDDYRACAEEIALACEALVAELSGISA